MKILILGVARSGTTSLLNSIGNLNYIKIGEPFNYEINKNKYDFPLRELNEYNRVCVKCTALQKPLEYSGTVLNFYKNFIHLFDKTILLDRRNLNEHLLSYANLRYRIYAGMNIWDSWDENDIDSDFLNKFFGSNLEIHIKSSKIIIDEISKELNIPITYYEDLYGIDRTKSKKLIQSWNLNLDEIQLNNMLHPKFKLKQEIKRLI